MKRALFSDEQTIDTLNEHQSDMNASKLCCKHGISDATFYTRRKKCSGSYMSEVKGLKVLEEENYQKRRTRAVVGIAPHLCRYMCS